MKRKLSKPLVAVNIVIVLLLLVTSAIMIFIANTQNNSLFNYHAKLVVGERLDNKIGDKCLVFVKLDDTSKLNKGSYLLCAVNGVSSIIKADEVDSNIISYRSKSGEALKLDTTTQDYFGRVTFSSNFLGSILSAFSSKENVSLTFILIGGIFIISMLSLTIIYSINKSKIALSNNAELGYQEEMHLFDEDDEADEEDADYVFNEDILITPQTTKGHDEIPIDIPDILNKKTLPPDDMACQLHGEIDFIHVYPEDIPDSSQAEDILTEIEEVNLPPYYLLDDDIPSIDNLMTSIDAQFGFPSNENQTQDEDIKIFPIKK